MFYYSLRFTHTYTQRHTHTHTHIYIHIHTHLDGDCHITSTKGNTVLTGELVQGKIEHLQT